MLSSVVVVVLCTAGSCLSSTVVQAENERKAAVARQERMSVCMSESLLKGLLSWRTALTGTPWLPGAPAARDDYLSVVVVVVVVFFTSIAGAGFTIAFLTMTLEATILSPTLV